MVEVGLKDYIAAMATVSRSTDVSENYERT